MDPVIKSHLLYQLSYTPIKRGASDGSRTHNLDLGKVALYQLSYTRFKRTGLNLADEAGVRNSKSRFFLRRFFRCEKSADRLR